MSATRGETSGERLRRMRYAERLLCKSGLNRYREDSGTYCTKRYCSGISVVLHTVYSKVSVCFTSTFLSLDSPTINQKSVLAFDIPMIDGMGHTLRSSSKMSVFPYILACDEVEALPSLTAWPT